MFGGLRCSSPTLQSGILFFWNSPTQWKLRNAMRRVNKTLEKLKLKQHPGKTFIGRAKRGFDFLGFAITAEGFLSPSKATIENFYERIARLYEQVRILPASGNTFGSGRLGFDLWF